MFYPKSDLRIADGVLRALAGTGAADAAISAADLVGALSGAIGLPRERLAVLPLAQQGTYHRVFRGTDKKSEKAWLLRANRLSLHLVDWQLYSDIAVGAALAGAGLDHAQVHAVDCTRERVPFDFSVQDFLEGEPLSARDAEDARIMPLVPAVAEYLRRVHRIGGSGFGFLDVSRVASGSSTDLAGLHGRWEAFLRRNLVEHVDAVVHAGLASPAEAQRILRHFEDAREALEKVEPRLLHGDCGNHNILVRPGGGLAFIDWEDALLGDPLFDVAFWATFHPERRWGAFFAAYLHDGAEPGGLFWLYYLRIALSKTVHRLRFGYADRPDRPKASLRIQRGLQGLGTLQGTPR